MLENREGTRVPEVIFHTRQDHEWVDVTSSEIFKGKKVIVFSLPGAFTPTCSSSHVPRFSQLADTFKEHGVDEILKIHDSSTRENIHLVSGMKAWGLVIMLSIIWGGLFFFVEMVAK